MTDFDEFWAAYPLKTGKGHARKAFEKAMKITDLATILKGIEAYKENKPEWKAYKHPSTWLNGECWEDEYVPSTPTMSEVELMHKRIKWEQKYRRDPALVPRDIRKIFGLGEYAKSPS